MRNSVLTPTPDSAADRLDSTLSALRQRLGLLRWLLPLGMFVLVGLYEIGPARWALAEWGVTGRLAVDIAVYGVLGPALAAVLLDLLGRWIDERETTAAQSLALARVRERARRQHALSDDTLQTLFAASAMLTALQDHHRELPPEARAQIEATHIALAAAINRLYAGLDD